MKISKTQLKKIIKEELQTVIEGYPEADSDYVHRPEDATRTPAEAARREKAAHVRARYNQLTTDFFKQRTDPLHPVAKIEGDVKKLGGATDKQIEDYQALFDPRLAEIAKWFIETGIHDAPLEQ